MSPKKNIINIQTKDHGTFCHQIKAVRVPIDGQHPFRSDFMIDPENPAYAIRLTYSQVFRVVKSRAEATSVGYEDVHGEFFFTYHNDDPVEVLSENGMEIFKSEGPRLGTIK